MTAVAVREHDIIGASVDGTVRRFDVRIGRMYVDELDREVSSWGPVGDTCPPSRSHMQDPNVRPSWGCLHAGDQPGSFP